ncbi:MAG: type II secretion system F family protein [Planctomycetota bacterium]|nr:type II secretion system F family protein [Planctomycetota bacterium]
MLAELAPGTLPILFVASALLAAAVYVFVRTIRNTLYSEDLSQTDEWRYDVTRINALREQSVIYRIFYPLIRVFAALNRGMLRDSLPEVERETQAAGFSRFWTPEEFLARQQVMSLLIMPLFVFVCVEVMGTPGIVLAVVLTGLTSYILRRRLANQAHYRLFQIKKKLPFLLDLVTLLMEAGSTFMQALHEGVREFAGQPVGVEFGRVLAEISMGKSRSMALETMRDRLRDDEITAIIGSIVQGETLGTPLSTVFRTQADVLRIKRTQRAETIAGEAGVKMLLPGILVMASTVIVILGPFLLGFIYQEYMS